MVASKDLAFVPWEFIFSRDLHKEHQSSRPAQKARFELTDLLLDEVPSRDVPASGIIGMFHLQQLLSLSSVSLALCKAASLQILRTYERAFMRLAGTRFTADSGLQAPRVEELPATDRQVWSEVNALFQKGWTCLDPAYFADLHSCLDDGMLFVKVPSGTAITVGSRLLEAHRVPMTQPHDLHNVVLSGKRVWLRVADSAAPKRKLSDCSAAFLKFWHQWGKTPGILRVLEAPRRATLVATVDAMRQGDRFAIGGFLRFSSCVIWFSKLHSAGLCFFWADAQ